MQQNVQGTTGKRKNQESATEGKLRRNSVFGQVSKGGKEGRREERHLKKKEQHVEKHRSMNGYNLTR